MLKKETYVYVAITGANLVKIGRSTNVPQRSRNYKTIDPDHEVVFEMPMGELNLDKKIHELTKTFGFGYKKSREVVSMAPEMVIQILKGEPPTGIRTRAEVLLSVLQAEVSPGLTVEAACDACWMALPVAQQPGFAIQKAHASALSRAGLRYSCEDYINPGFVSVFSKELFFAALPQLKDTYPTMWICGGVRVGSNGQPALAVPLKLL
jgi:hypothetical protein